MMIAFFWLIFLLNSLICWGLISLHHWLASAMVGAIIGASIALYWFWGSIQQTVEYWCGAGPRWMHFLFANPKITERNIRKISKRYKCSAGKFLKVESLVVALFAEVILTRARIPGETYHYAAILFPITWILCVCLSELYFKRAYARNRFTRIQEDSDL